MPDKTVVLKFTSPAGVVIFFEPTEEAVTGKHWFEAKQYMNSTFLECGRLENYSFNPRFVDIPTDEEREMFLQLRDRSVHLIGK